MTERIEVTAPATAPVVLITGATSGIGRHAALYLARAGYRVIATGRRESALRELEAEAVGLPLETVTLEVTDAESIQAAREAVDARTGGHGVDVLINNAGFGLAAPMAEVSDEDLRRQYDTNVFGLMAVTRAFLPAMVRRGSGRILNVTSVGGRLTMPLFGAYNSTKYAVESMSDALRLELAPFGVDVVLIEPGVIDTGFAQRSRDEVEAYATADSLWAPVLARADEIEAQSDRFAVGPAVISRTMHRAIRSRWPRARYVAPFRYRLLLALLVFVPTRLVDAVLRLGVGLTRRGLRSEAGAEAQIAAAKR
jgi:NAD(P)-dependent dehydrogenase (short-subunit alcohol dehydrogenase family)